MTQAQKYRKLSQFFVVFQTFVFFDAECAHQMQWFRAKNGVLQLTRTFCTDCFNWFASNL